MMARFFLILGLFLAAFPLLHAPARAQLPPAPLPAGLIERTLTFQGVERRFLLFQPARLRPGAPVLIALHGGGQSARKMFLGNNSPHLDWLPLAEKEGFLLLAPNGTNPATGDPAGGKQHWHDLRNQWPQTNGPPDDSGFLAALAEWAVQERQADPKRVYAAGSSNGGLMTFRLLLERPDVFAAGAAFNAALPDRPLAAPSAARPILIGAGTEDPVIRWEGGELLNSGIVLKSMPDTLAFWLDLHGLDGTRPVARRVLPDREPDDGCRFEVTAWGGTAAAPVVEFWAVRGGGHWLPTMRELKMTPRLLKFMGPRCRDVNGAAAAWAFLREHRLP